jgi:MFS family permease
MFAVQFYDVMVAVHIAAVVIAFGVTFTYPLTGPLTARTAPQHVPWLHRMQAETGKKIIMPAGLLLLAAGIYLVADSDAWSLGDWWVTFGLVAIVVLLGLGGAYFGPREERLAELASRDLGPDGQGALSEEYRRMAQQLGMVGAAASLLVLTTVVVMTLGARGSFV